ncbi:MAG: hypothetical protein SOU16_10225 [Faecalimonas sp.]|nr:hypothetical protein [Faecalimonas sp.]
MSRLTEWIPGEHKAIPRMDLRSNGYEKCATRLAEYEDTVLTPNQVQELKERGTAKNPITYSGTNRADCPICGATVRGIGKPFGEFCGKCGQRLDWSE